MILQKRVTTKKKCEETNMKRYICFLLSVMLLCSFVFLTACSSETQTKPQKVSKDNKLSRYVVVEDIGDNYKSSFDKLTEDGKLIQIMDFEWVVDRKTKQIFIYDTYCNDIPDSFETFVLQPLLDNGEPVYYNDKLPE